MPRLALGREDLPLAVLGPAIVRSRDRILSVGASAWHARVPYQHDIGAALEQARWDAYRRGDYYREPPNEEARAMDEEEYVARGVAWIKTSVPADLADVEWSGDEFRAEWR